MEWYVAVIYTDGHNENVPVSKIKRFQPKDLQDYDPLQKYVIKTSMWNTDIKEERYKGYIVRLAETLEELEKSLRRKRPRCPLLQQRDSDGPITSTEDELFVPPDNSVQSQRQSSSNRKRVKKLAAENEMEKFFQGHSSVSAGCSCPSADLSSENVSFKKKIMALEVALANNSSTNTIDSSFAVILKKLEDMDKRFQKIECSSTSVSLEELNMRIKNMENAFSKSRSSSIQSVRTVQDWLNSSDFLP